MMTEFRHYNSIDESGKSVKLTIASGPVIIEKGKVSLDKHGEDDFWKFPGGAQKDNLSFQENTKKEVKAELGIEVELSGEPFVFAFERDYKGVKEYVILIHYRAGRKDQEIKPRGDVREYVWHDVNNLPKGLAPNIMPVVKYFIERN